MIMKIINHKHLALYLIILCVTLFMVFYRYIDYAYKTPSRLQSASQSQDSDLSPEALEQAKNKTILQHFFDLRANFTLNSTYRDFIGIKFRIVPVVIISVIFLYTNIKNCLIKYNIGRNTQYQSEIDKLQRKLSLIPAFFSTITIVILFCIGLTSTQPNLGIHFTLLYDHSDIISSLMRNNLTVLVVFEIINFIGIYILTQLALRLTERYGKLDGILIFLIAMWIVPIFNVTTGVLYEAKILLPHTILINGAYVGASLFQMITPIFITAIISFWLRRLNTDEIEL